METKDALFQYLLRLGDNALILGHRLSEWCGKAPILEEDIAVANTALDLIGQTQLWLGYAAEVEDEGRDADVLAMRRDVWDFRSLLLVEQPNGDFGQTIMRQFLFDQWHLALLQALAESRDEQISAIAQRAVKEVTYHAERSTDLVIRLGDGTEESNRRMQAALDLLYPYVGEMFVMDEVDDTLNAAEIAPDLQTLRPAYDEALEATMRAATLFIPESRFAHKGGKTGFRHSEHLGHLLTEMQWLQRAYPDARW